MSQLWQPIKREDFGPGNADLAGCDSCGHRWMLDGDGCGRIDTCVMCCPACESYDTGPVYAVPDD